MAFDKPTRNRLASFVGKTRDLIADEFTQQFQSLYGMSDKGTITPLEQLGHLDDTGLATAALLRERIDYLVKTHPNDRDGIKAAVARLAREQGFTVLNRLAAIRMSEKRGLIIESVGRGYQSKGFKVFEQVAGAGLGDTYRRYCRYLYCLFDELAVDLGVLFDRRSPQGLIFPGETALQALFSLLNALDLDPLWAEDETIGWIYQYYNDPAERKKMREESAAPRNSRELAVRNQFFTPRYVVEFLTDNTLGRIWYEMTQGKTRLKDQCRYLVRRPTEIFLKPDETAPETLTPEGLSQEELLKQPVYILYRPLKDPRKIGLLDPACGSMHFGLYAFDLFETIYEEAWELDLGSLRRDYPEKEVFFREVPRLIVEHNIHGIDIDPRATQIAGLSLWLRAQKSWQAQNIPAAQRPRIMRSNIVCAEPMPGSPEMLKDFTATLHPPLLGQLVEKVFAQMQLAGEAGSLLKIEEDIATLVKEAKKFWKTRPKAEQTELSLGLEAKPKQGEFPLDVSGISDERFWETAEERIYAALQTYAEQAESGSYQRRLFAEDASRGFAFIDLCRKRYDVVLMNPPYGSPSEVSKGYLSKQYRSLWIEIYLCFIRRMLQLSVDGFVGSLTSRTWMYLSKFESLRKEIVNKRALWSLVNLGSGVLDGAAVEVTAYVLSNASLASAVFISVEDLLEPADSMVSSIELLHNGMLNEKLRLESIAAFEQIPGCAIISGVNAAVRKSLTGVTVGIRPFVAKPGLGTRDDFRFARLRWEVPALLLNKHNWATAIFGGQSTHFFCDHVMCVNWSSDGAEMKAFIAANYGSASRSIINEGYYFRSGLTYQYTGKTFRVHPLPADSIITMAGQGLYTEPEDWYLWLTILNTSTVTSLLKTINPGRFFQATYVNGLPVPSVTESQKELLVDIGSEAVRCQMQILREQETSPSFSAFAVRDTINSVTEYYSLITKEAKTWLIDADKTTASVYQFINHEPKIDSAREESVLEDDENDDEKKLGAADTVLYLVGTAIGRWDIRFATGERQPPELPDPFAPLPVCPPGLLQNADGLPDEPKDVPADYPLRISWPGILVDDENHPEDIVARIREAIEAIWKERADAIEQEACELLGVKTLRDYFRRPAGFFADHLKRYSKSRRQAPIYWPLSTAKSSYTLWIYYHRLTDQTLHTALADFVDPKLKAVRAEISALRETATHRNRLEELLDMEKELVDFHTEIERIIKFPWKPNLNDGVLITACPLWKLFRLPKWQKELKACWEKLEKGDYDWAHLAHSIWPERVENACIQDRSIAIAHNLEHLCQLTPSKPKAKRGRKAAVVDGERKRT